MQRKQVALVASTAKIIARGIRPNVGTMTAVSPKFDVIAMRSATILEHQDVLVLAPIKRAHPGIVLDPDAVIFELKPTRLAGSKDLCHVSPIHEREYDRAV